MYRENQCKEIVVSEIVKPRNSWYCKFFGHGKFSYNALVSYYAIRGVANSYFFLGASYICNQCLSIQMEAFPLYSENFIIRNYGVNTSPLKTLESYYDIQAFLKKHKITRKKKWYESHDYAFLTTRSNEKLALCLITYDLLLVRKETEED